MVYGSGKFGFKLVKVGRVENSGCVGGKKALGGGMVIVGICGYLG
jgi:hypothetical protein